MGMHEATVFLEYSYPHLNYNITSNTENSLNKGQSLPRSQMLIDLIVVFLCIPKIVKHFNESSYTPNRVSDGEHE